MESAAKCIVFLIFFSSTVFQINGDNVVKNGDVNFEVSTQDILYGEIYEYDVESSTQIVFYEVVTVENQNVLESQVKVGDGVGDEVVDEDYEEVIEEVVTDTSYNIDEASEKENPDEKESSDENDGVNANVESNNNVENKVQTEAPNVSKENLTKSEIPKINIPKLESQKQNTKTNTKILTSHPLPKQEITIKKEDIISVRNKSPLKHAQVHAKDSVKKSQDNKKLVVKNKNNNGHIAGTNTGVKPVPVTKPNLNTKSNSKKTLSKSDLILALKRNLEENKPNIKGESSVNKEDKQIKSNKNSDKEKVTQTDETKPNAQQSPKIPPKPSPKEKQEQPLMNKNTHASHPLSNKDTKGNVAAKPLNSLIINKTVAKNPKIVHQNHGKGNPKKAIPKHPQIITHNKKPLRKSKHVSRITPENRPKEESGKPTSNPSLPNKSSKIEADQPNESDSEPEVKKDKEVKAKEEDKNKNEEEETRKEEIEKKHEEKHQKIETKKDEPKKEVEPKTEDKTKTEDETKNEDETMKEEVETEKDETKKEVEPKEEDKTKTEDKTKNEDETMKEEVETEKDETKKEGESKKDETEKEKVKAKKDETKKKEEETKQTKAKSKNVKEQIVPIKNMNKHLLEQNNEKMKTKIENNSEQIKPKKETLEKAKQQTIYEKKRQSNLYIVAVCLTLIVSTILLTIVGVYFRKISLERRRYVGHTLLETDDEMPLFSRAEYNDDVEGYQSWNRMQHGLPP